MKIEYCKRILFSIVNFPTSPRSHHSEPEVNLRLGERGVDSSTISMPTATGGGGGPPQPIPETAEPEPQQGRNSVVLILFLYSNEKLSQLAITFIRHRTVHRVHTTSLI